MVQHRSPYLLAYPQVKDEDAEFVYSYVADWWQRCDSMPHLVRPRIWASKRQCFLAHTSPTREE